MNARIVKKTDSDSIALTARSLTEKNCVIIPTDTVYGFSGVVPETENAIARIKGRNGQRDTKPMIRLISRPQDIFAYTDTAVPEELLSRWPGALTIIVPLKALYAESDGAASASCAFRCPGDAWLRDVIAQTGSPIYSTSANRTGEPVLTRIADIIAEFKKDVPLIVDAGDSEDSLPSTIVALGENGWSVVRQGVVRV
jgi:L-threonylcarbamoyladenylate synthase